MSERSSLETQISTKLMSLSAENMQRVAEDYARVRYPDRFPRFDFRALSPEGKSRGGWPDAWIEQRDGKIDGVEATNTKDKSGVDKHLNKYLSKAKDSRPPLTGFIHVSGNPAAQFTVSEIAAWKERFINEARIDPARLDLVFGGGLVEILTRPEFARTRIEILGLSEAPQHFRLYRSRQSPDEARLGTTFRLTHDEYSACRVHRPALAEDVSARLERYRCAFVRGIGASGKTVLAWLIAMDHAAKRLPSYTLDIAECHLCLGTGTAPKVYPIPLDRTCATRAQMDERLEVAV